jgi:glycosyltransferase involved in cell wall biosynthesis
MFSPRPRPPHAPRYFYATAAPADFISDYHSWREKMDNTVEVSVTFSSQILDFVASRGGTCLMVSGHPNRRTLADDGVEIIHFPKPEARGLRWHFWEIVHGFQLLRRALAYRPDIALVDSGTTAFWVMLLFRLTGARLLVILHNALYPAGIEPLGLKKLRLQVQRWALRRADCLGVSPECVRQAGTGRVFQPLFRRAYFDQIAPSKRQGSFNVLYVGRIVENKGALDIPRIARVVEQARPGLVRWIVVGDGKDLPRLRRDSEGLPIDILGWRASADQITARSSCHAVIVPTRTDFAEGFSMAAVEGVLSGRPVITNAIVPALEVIRPACVEVEANNIEAYAAAVLALASDEDYWARLIRECDALKPAFFDEENALSRAIDRVLRDGASQ